MIVLDHLSPFVPKDAAAVAPVFYRRQHAVEVERIALRDPNIAGRQAAITGAALP
jgi:hypothetical protein